MLNFNTLGHLSLRPYPGSVSDQTSYFLIRFGSKVAQKRVKRRRGGGKEEEEGVVVMVVMEWSEFGGGGGGVEGFHSALNEILM